MNVEQEKITKDFFIIPKWVVKSGLWAIGSNIAKSILISLCLFSHYLTRTCRPSIFTLAEKSGISKGSVKKAIDFWISVGVVKKWYHKRRCHYQIFPTGDKIPIETITYLQQISKLPKQTVSYPRNEKGQFKRRKRKDIVPSGIIFTNSNGATNTVSIGDRNRDRQNRDIQIETLEKKKKKKVVSFNSPKCLDLALVSTKIMKQDNAQIIANWFCENFTRRWSCYDREHRSICSEHWEVIIQKLEKQIEKVDVKNPISYYKSAIHQYLLEKSDEINEEIKHIKKQTLDFSTDDNNDYFIETCKQWVKRGLPCEEYWTRVNNLMENFTAEQKRIYGILAQEIWGEKELCQK